MQRLSYRLRIIPFHHGEHILSRIKMRLADFLFSLLEKMLEVISDNPVDELRGVDRGFIIGSDLGKHFVMRLLGRADEHNPQIVTHWRLSSFAP